MKNTFLNAINEKRRVKVVFYSKEDGMNIERICAPMDFGPSRKFKDGLDRFHLWDYYPDQGKKPHPLPLTPSQIVSITLMAEHFDPAEFITWNVKTSPWHYSRDWGQYS
ncbi:hypothetical protein [Acinetobacter johnsonii]|uniref:hypothetical protein n=1 Tax=Acinetobacter johnsonii TaxID=40214 RepID=UPI003F543779